MNLEELVKQMTWKEFRLFQIEHPEYFPYKVEPMTLKKYKKLKVDNQK